LIGADAVTPTILVITNREDATADRVVHELNERGVHVMRFDAADFHNGWRCRPSAARTAGRATLTAATGRCGFKTWSAPTTGALASSRYPRA
jgi:hypothetical protein